VGVVLLSSVAPLVLAGTDNPEGVDPVMVEKIRSMWRADFGQWIEDGADAYFATQFPETTVSNEDVAWTFPRYAGSVIPSCLRPQSGTDGYGLA
jgi:hypothetical protein